MSSVGADPELEAAFRYHQLSGNRRRFSRIAEVACVLFMLTIASLLRAYPIELHVSQPLMGVHIALFWRCLLHQVGCIGASIYCPGTRDSEEVTIDYADDALNSPLRRPALLVVIELEI
jgi:hypothetical protein